MNRTVQKETLMDPEFHHKILKGKKISLDAGNGPVNLTLGRLDRRAEEKLSEDGFSLVMGEIRTASGHRFHAILDLCVMDSCEHYGSIVYALDKDGNVLAVEQGQPEFSEWEESMQEMIPGFEVFPYKYRYRDTQLRELDHHVGHDGWSLA